MCVFNFQLLVNNLATTTSKSDHGVIESNESDGLVTASEVTDGLDQVIIFITLHFLVDILPFHKQFYVFRVFLGQCQQLFK